MSANFLAKLKKRPARPDADKRPLRARVLRAVMLLAWMAAGLGLGIVVVRLLLQALAFFGVPLAYLDETIYNAVVMAVLYVVVTAVIVSVPWLVRNYRTTKEELGLTRLVSWGDIGMAMLSVVVYFLLAWLFLAAAKQLFPALDLAQAQETGFSSIKVYYQYALALAALVVVVPVIEEILFRGYFYGKLRRLMPLWVAALVTSLVFAAVHGQWNVAIDTFALSLVLCALREVTGTIWAGILLHMFKNAIAFYVLFIYPVM